MVGSLFANNYIRKMKKITDNYQNIYIDENFYGCYRTKVIIRKKYKFTDKTKLKGGNQMIYTYAECQEEYKSDYGIKKAIKNKELYKLSRGLYSDMEYESEVAVVMKKYPDAVFTLNSAFFYQGLTDTIPSKYYLETNKDATKIADSKVKQVFDNYDSMQIGLDYMIYNGDEIRVFNKERLLIELIRNKSKLPFDYYKEILGNFRKIIYDLDFSLVEEYAERLPKTKMVMNVIQMEVF